jgi:chaperone BCS1
MAAASRPPTAVWPESLDTPGIIPRHVMRAVSEALPIFEVLQRALRRLGLHGTTGELEKVVALIGFYKAVKPVYNYLKSFFWWAFTSHVTISEHDPAAKEVLAWMGAEGTHNSHTRQAVLVTSSAGTGNAGSTEEAYLRLLSGSDITSGRGDRKSACLPTIGTRLFW